MTEIKINEENIASLRENISGIVEYVQANLDEMVDPEEDIFTRYMAFHRLGGLQNMFMASMQLLKQAQVQGHNLGHPFLDTPKSKECGWSERFLHQDPFFVNERTERLCGAFNDFLGTLKEALELTDKDNSNDAH